MQEAIDRVVDNAVYVVERRGHADRLIAMCSDEFLKSLEYVVQLGQIQHESGPETSSSDSWDIKSAVEAIPGSIDSWARGVLPIQGAQVLHISGSRKFPLYLKRQTVIR